MAFSSLLLSLALVALSAAAASLPGGERVSDTAVQDDKANSTLLSPPGNGQPPHDTATGMGKTVSGGALKPELTRAQLPELAETTVTGTEPTDSMSLPTQLPDDAADGTEKNANGGTSKPELARSQVPESVEETPTTEPQPVDVSGSTPLKLVCPSVNPERYHTTAWYLLRGTSFFGLYRIDHESGRVSEYLGRRRLNETLNVTDPPNLTIFDDTCKHTGTYQCQRNAHVGFRNERYTFHVANCTVFSRDGNYTAFRNTASHPMSTTSGLMIAAGAVASILRSCY